MGSGWYWMTPAMEAVLMMTPPPWRRIAGTAACVPAITDHRPTASVCSHRSGGAPGKRGRWRSDPGVVVQDVQPTVRLLRERHHPLEVVAAGHVALHESGPAACLLDERYGLPAAFSVPVGGDDRGARPRPSAR